MLTGTAGISALANQAIGIRSFSKKIENKWNRRNANSLNATVEVVDDIARERGIFCTLGFHICNLGELRLCMRY